MTLSKFSEETCPQCGGPTVVRPKYPYPVIEQILFGLSFILFLFFFESISRAPKFWLWIWTCVQVGLGVVLVRGRIRAKQRILRCIRCSQDLR